jgi:hypothetical protein
MLQPHAYYLVFHLISYARSSWCCWNLDSLGPTDSAKSVCKFCWCRTSRILIIAVYSKPKIIPHNLVDFTLQFKYKSYQNDSYSHEILLPLIKCSKYFILGHFLLWKAILEPQNVRLMGTNITFLETYLLRLVSGSCFLYEINHMEMASSLLESLYALKITYWMMVSWVVPGLSFQTDLKCSCLEIIDCIHNLSEMH